MNREWFDQQFIQAARNPDSWQMYATSLKKSVDLLYVEVSKEIEKKLEKMKSISEQNPGKTEKLVHLVASVIPVYKLLCGLTLENLIKGIAVSRNPNLYVNEERKKLNWETNKSHEIHELVDTLNIPVSEEESNYLKMLSENIRWAGRYPTAFKSEDGRNEFSVKTFSVNEDPKMFNQLYNRFHTLLENELGYKSFYK